MQDERCIRVSGSEGEPLLDFFRGLAGRTYEERGGAGCVVARTKVLLADGSLKAMEEVALLWNEDNGELNTTCDKLLSADGTVVYPIVRFEGPEVPFPTIKVYAEGRDKSYEVEVTKWHSLMRNHYSLIQAYMLSEGDTLLTDTGLARVTHIEYCRYLGKVYNLALAGPGFVDSVLPSDNPPRDARKNHKAHPQVIPSLYHSLMAARPKHHIMFANGVASGSLVLQLQLIELFKDGININQFA
jgi:hypothetical protein